MIPIMDHNAIPITTEFLSHSITPFFLDPKIRSFLSLLSGFTMAHLTNVQPLLSIPRTNQAPEHQSTNHEGIFSLLTSKDHLVRGGSFLIRFNIKPSLKTGPILGLRMDSAKNSLVEEF